MKKILIFLVFAVLLLLPFRIVFGQLEESLIQSQQAAEANIGSQQVSAGSKRYVPYYLSKIFDFSNAGDVSGPGALVLVLFKGALGVVGVVAFGVVIYAAFIRLFSAGNTGRVKESNDLIKGAIFGIILLLGAYILFNTINPSILNVGAIDEQLKSLAPVPSISTSTGQVPTSTSPSSSGVVPTSCTGCVKLSNLGGAGQLFNVKSTACSGGYKNCYLSKDDVDKLNKLVVEAEKLGLPSSAWRVTEAYPPTVQHSSRCHYDGSCLDIALMPETATKEKVDNFIKAANASGFKVKNEYPNFGGTVFKTTKGDHLHVQ